MGLVKSEILLLLFLMAICGSCKGYVYKIGDSDGWTIIGNVDYNKWASSKTFQVGDTLIFEYNPQFHNVLQVSRSDFHSCNAMSPISGYATGNDTIVIHRPGHYYYICGFVGHCQAGQKVDIRVPKKPNSHGSAAIPSLGPIEAPHETEAPTASPIGPPAPSPSTNSGESLMFEKWILGCNVGLLLVMGWAFN